MRAVDLIDSGNRELADTLGEPRIKDGKLIETYKESEFPQFGYSDSFVIYERGRMTQFRALFYNGKMIGYQTTYFPWNMFAPIESYLQVDVDDDLPLGAVICGRKVYPMGRFDDFEQCIRFDDMQELADCMEELTQYLRK